MPKEHENKSLGIPSTETRNILPFGKNYIFSIGINEYLYCPPLFNAVKDANDVIDLLTQKYDFERDNVFSLYNEEANQSNIIQYFDHLSNTITPQDSLIIYFSGHGEFKENINEGYWIPVEGQLNQVGTYISNSLITKYIKAIKSFHTFVIADSCFSGSLFTEKRILNSSSREKLASIPSRYLLTAGRNEVVSDGKPGDNSPFADSVLYHLNHNKEPAFSIVRFGHLVVEDVGSNERQIPRIEPLQDVGHRGGQFMFYLKGFQHKISKEPTGRKEKNNRKTVSTASTSRPRLSTTKWKITNGVLAIASLILSVVFLYNSSQWKILEPSAILEKKYDLVKPIEEGFLIAIGTNRGFANREAKVIISPGEYDEFYGFSEGLSLVKKYYKFGWVDTLGQEMIQLKYDDADSFKDGVAKVGKDGKCFFIDQRDSIVKDCVDSTSNHLPRDEEPANLITNQTSIPKISLNEKNIQLGEIMETEEKKFDVKIKNKGSIKAKGISVNINCNFIKLNGRSRFDLNPGQTKVLRFVVEGKKIPPSFSHVISIKGDQISPTRMYITVKGQLKEELAEEPKKINEKVEIIQLPCHLGKADIEVRFQYDGKPYHFSSDKEGMINYKFPKTIEGKPISIFFKNSSGTSTQRQIVVSLNNCIPIPNSITSN